MQEICKTFKIKLDEIKVWLSKELSTLRTGRATVSILDSVYVDAYGSKSSLNTVAAILVEDAKTIKITPWDKGILKDIEQTLQKANLGLSITSNGIDVRVIFPDLTTETRMNLVKQGYKKVEDAKVSARSERADSIKKIEKFAKDNSISEDEIKRTKEEIQKIVDSSIDEFDTFGSLKEKEITTQ